MMSPDDIADEIIRGYSSDSGYVLGISSRYREALRILLLIAVEKALTIGPEDCKQCGCTHATAYDLGRADERAATKITT